jgi:hypothetical protein
VHVSDGPSHVATWTQGDTRIVSVIMACVPAAGGRGLIERGGK